ncbi:hypothetical protein ACOME3_008026 [Neoechinorhynchus agilis]
MDSLEKVYSLITNGIANAPPLLEKRDLSVDGWVYLGSTKDDHDSIRKANKIRVEGCECPLLTTIDDLIKSWEFPGAFTSNLRSIGHSVFTPVQMQSIPLLLKKRELMVCAPTGSGKTLAFLIPLVGNLALRDQSECGFRALVLAPSRELATQIHSQCESLTSGLWFRSLMLPKLTKTAVKKLSERMKKTGSKERYRILISTPNRLVHLLSEDNIILDLSNVEYLVLDEADKLFEATGKRCFREQLPLIFEKCSSSELKRALFSATYSHDVETWCRTANEGFVHVTVGSRNAAVDSVKQRLLYCGCEDGKLLGLRNVLREGFLPPILIFVETKQRAAELFKELLYDGIMVGAIHSDLTNNQREKIVEAFADGRIWVLICTDLMGRGMDFKEVSLVINYDIPSSAVSYIHRIGRAGRAGKTGTAITFYTDEEIPILRSIANLVKQSGGDVPDYLLRFKKQSTRSRRKAMTRPRKRRNIGR